MLYEPIGPSPGPKGLANLSDQQAHQVSQPAQLIHPVRHQ
jgi:hypothetical protein